MFPFTLWLMLLTAMSSGLQAQSQPNPQITQIDATTLASVLLTPNEVQKIKNIPLVNPATIKFYGRLGTNRDVIFNFSIARTWHRPQNIWTLIVNALTAFPSAEAAKEGLAVLSREGEQLSNANPVGDQSIAKFQEPKGEEPAFIAYYFTVGPYVAQVTVFGDPNVHGEKEMFVSHLEPAAHTLAKAQEEKMRPLLSGTIPLVERDFSSLRFPQNLAGTTLLGSAPVTPLEWRTLEKDTAKTTIAGFQKGATRSFHLMARPEEIARVAVFTFDTDANAKAFVKELTARKLPKIPLPPELKNNGVAVDVTQYEILEFRGAKGSRSVDILLLSPFGKIDKKEAKKDLIDFAKQLLAY